MAQVNTDWLRWIGWHAQGDFGPWTCYTSRRGKLVAYPRSPPLSPASPEQLEQRSKFRLAANLWRGLTPAARALWERASKAASLGCTGFNLFTQAVVTGSGQNAAAVSRQTGITLTIPETTPSLPTG